MIAFFIFLFAAAIVFFGARLAEGAERAGRPSPFGLIFLFAVLLAAFGGWAMDALHRLNEPVLNAAITLENALNLDVSRPTRRGFPADFFLLLLPAAVYALSAIREKRRQPAWLVDIVVVAASLASLAIFANVRHAYDESPPDSPFFGLSTIGLVLSLFCLWAIARLTAALNRVPQATGGYLGVVALLVLLLLHRAGTTISFFPYAAGAALAGAGLATVPVALKKPAFNLGWSGSLAMGFLLAQTVVFGLADYKGQTAVAMTLLVLALPLLDILFYRVKPRPQGSATRLHEGLMRRGFSPTKVALLYTAVSVWLGILGYLLSGLETGDGAGQTIARLLVVLFIGAGGFLLFFSVARVLMNRAPGEEIPESIEAFDVKISAVTMDEAIAKIGEFIQSRTPHHVVTTDANAILRAKEDPEYAAIVRRAAMATPDGYGVIWGARLLGYPIYERVTGVDMVTGICELAARNGYSIYILGSEPGENGEPGVAEIAATNLLGKYPGMRVAGTHHGFWRRDAKAEGLSAEEADARMADAVRAAAPDVLFVAMGIPAQEKFIAAQLERMQVPVSIGVGGSFDVYSGKFERAPQWVQRIGLEWLYRVFIDPSRWKRMGYVPRFMLLAIRVWLTGNKSVESARPPE